MTRYVSASGLIMPLLVFLLANAFPLLYLQVTMPGQPLNYDGSVGGLRFIEQRQPPVMIHPMVEEVLRSRGAAPRTNLPTTSNLAYNGGVGGIGVETTPKLYL